MKTALFAALAAVTFAPAAVAQTAAAPAPAAAAATAAKFNLETPIQDIVADAKAKAKAISARNEGGLVRKNMSKT